MKKRIEDLRVVSNKRLNKEFYVLKLFSSQGIPKILPGQFAQVQIEGSPVTFLRRPFSIYSVDYTENTLELLIKIVGAGTAQLALIEPHQTVNLLYPLGNFFTPPLKPSVLLVGGGTGVAPLLFLGKYLKEKHMLEPQFLMGYRTSELIVEKERFETIGKVHITTEDGSYGHKGLVIHHPVITENPSKFTKIYTCGPEIMMKEVGKIAGSHGIDCEVSLENLMGCGFGACLCCVVDTVEKGLINTCMEGPVFNTRSLKWSI